jgi:CHASE2 domain-containing sensor protein
MSLLAAAKSVIQSITRKGIGHWSRWAVLMVLGWFGGHALKQNAYLTNLRYWLYRHQLMLQSGAPGYPRQTAVVLLEDVDYWGPNFAARSPLKRDQLAKILDTLRLAGVNTIVLDVDLRSPDPSHPDLDFSDYLPEDAALLASVRALCSNGQTIVLSTSVQHQSGSIYRQLPSIYTHALTADPKSYSCLQAGYPQLPYDMRLVPGELQLDNGQPLDSLSLTAVKVVNPTAWKAAVDNADKGFRYSRYLSQADYQPRDGRRFRYTWADLQQADIRDLRNNLADKVVLIGGGWHSFAKGQGPTVDTYNSPVGPMPGVFLHANYIEALDGERGTFAPLSDLSVELLEFSLAIVLAIVGVLEIHAGWKWGAFLFSLILSLALGYVLLENLGVFFDFLVPILIMVAHTLVEELLEMRHQLRHLKHRAQGAAR